MARNWGLSTGCAKPPRPGFSNAERRKADEIGQAWASRPELSTIVYGKSPMEPQVYDVTAARSPRQSRKASWAPRLLEAPEFGEAGFVAGFLAS